MPSVTLKSKVQQLGLILPDGARRDADEVPPIFKRGVSLQWLSLLATALNESGAEKLTPHEVVSKLLHPGFPRHSRLFDCIPPQHTGEPSLRLVQPQNTPLCSSLEYTACALAPPPPPGQHTNTRTDPATIFLWTGFVALDYASLQPAAANEANEQAESWAAAVQACAREVATYTQGTLLVVDPAGTAIDCVRCMHEAWSSIAYGSNDQLRVSLALPPDVSLSILHRLLGLHASLDLSRLPTAALPRSQRLLADIKRTAGAQRASTSLGSAITRGTRLAVRAAASHSLHAATLHVAMLMQGGSLRVALGTAQEAVASHDVEGALEEMRELFAIYDADGSGELDREEMLQVLSDAGFGGEEAEEIYDVMNSDGEGGISLAEFEEWWMSGAGNANRNAGRDGGWGVPRVRGKATTSNLVASIRALVKLAAQHGHKEAARHLEQTLQEVTSGAGSKPGQLCVHMYLPPTKPVGAWQVVGDEALWAARALPSDMVVAARALYDVLLANMDLLPYHPMDLPRPPAHISEAPAAAGGSAADERVRVAAETAARLALAVYLEAFAYSVIAAVTGPRSMDVRTFVQAASTLLMHATTGGGAAGRSVSGAGNAPSDDPASTLANTKEGRLLIRQLINLKYGDAAASVAMRYEAGVALSQITAQAKAVAGGNTKRRSTLGRSSVVALDQYLQSTRIKPPSLANSDQPRRSRSPEGSTGGDGEGGGSVFAMQLNITSCDKAAKMNAILAQAQAMSQAQASELDAEVAATMAASAARRTGSARTSARRRAVSGAGSGGSRASCDAPISPKPRSPSGRLSLSRGTARFMPRKPSQLDLLSQDMSRLMALQRSLTPGLGSRPDPTQHSTTAVTAATPASNLAPDSPNLPPAATPIAPQPPHGLTPTMLCTRNRNCVTFPADAPPAPPCPPATYVATHTPDPDSSSSVSTLAPSARSSTNGLDRHRPPPIATTTSFTSHWSVDLPAATVAPAAISCGPKSAPVGPVVPSPSLTWPSPHPNARATYPLLNDPIGGDGERSMTPSFEDDMPQPPPRISVSAAAGATRSPHPTHLYPRQRAATVSPVVPRGGYGLMAGRSMPPIRGSRRERGANPLELIAPKSITPTPMSGGGGKIRGQGSKDSRSSRQEALHPRPHPQQPQSSLTISSLLDNLRTQSRGNMIASALRDRPPSPSKLSAPAPPALPTPTPPSAPSPRPPPSPAPDTVHLPHIKMGGAGVGGGGGRPGFRSKKGLHILGRAPLGGGVEGVGGGGGGLGAMSRGMEGGRGMTPGVPVAVRD